MLVYGLCHPFLLVFVVSYCHFFLFGQSTTKFGNSVMASAVYLNIDRHCNHDKRCQIENSFCQLQTTTCGICTCKAGFAMVIDEENQSMLCQKMAKLGDACSEKSLPCTGNHVYCSNVTSTCTCRQEFKNGMDGTSCIPVAMDKMKGDICYASTQCYNSLECINFACGCPPGFKANNFECVMLDIGSNCRNDRDCGNIPNSLCNPSTGKCDCQPSFKTVTLQWAAGEKPIERCVSNFHTVHNKEGSPCSSGFIVDDSETPLQFCQAPLVCNSCSGASQCVNTTHLSVEQWLLEDSGQADGRSGASIDNHHFLIFISYLFLTL